ncbi:MAG: response regulator transcription factor [Rhodobiaceae bacterium]|nr:response regulator transcription factor [Rhodobiaceae bacterium]
MSGSPADDAPHLLIVDDDRRIRSLLSTFLQNEGFRVTTAENAATAREKMRGLEFDLLILDVMMPGESGTELAASLRETNTVPILMLTARAEAEHRIKGLESGADDYLPKPFEPRELVLRINNILKRAQAKPRRPLVETARIGPLTFHVQRGELTREDESIRLTERERDLLRIFCSQPGEIVSRLALVEDGSAGSERAVDVQINRLRRKIETDPANPIYLQTVRGVGYRLMVDEW